MIYTLLFIFFFFNKSLNNYTRVEINLVYLCKIIFTYAKNFKFLMQNLLKRTGKTRETILMVFKTSYATYKTYIVQLIIRSILYHLPIITMVNKNQQIYTPRLFTDDSCCDFHFRRRLLTRSNGTKIGFGRPTKALVCCCISSDRVRVLC